MHALTTTMSTTQSLSLVNGASMPLIGFGTWGVKSHDIDHSLRTAVSAGYRLFDLAPVYNNEKAVGKTLSALISEGAITRENIFLTSKVPPADACDRERLLSKVRQTLQDLQTSYLDLYLVHWPFCVRNDSPTWPPPMAYQMGYSPQQLLSTWRVMEEVVSLGLARSVGLSNIGVRRLRALLSNPLSVRPAVVQVEHHPYNANRQLRSLCAAVSPPIRVTAYSSLGSNARPSKYQEGQSPLLEDAEIHRIANELGTSPAALSLAWAVQSGVAIIPKSSHAERIIANFKETLSLSPKLTLAQIAALDALDKKFHYLENGWRGYAWKKGMELDELYDDPAPRMPFFMWPLLIVGLCVVYNTWVHYGVTMSRKDPRRIAPVW